MSPERLVWASMVRWWSRKLSSILCSRRVAPFLEWRAGTDHKTNRTKIYRWIPRQRPIPKWITEHTLSSTGTGRLRVEGGVAALSMDVNEDAGLRPGYKLKLNSYDLGVDIELYDALQRIRFEHPDVKVVVLTSAKERMLCSGANIYMLV